MGKAKALVPLVGLVGLIATLSPSTAAASELFPPLTWEGTVTSQDQLTGYFPGDTGGWTSTASVVWKLIPNLNHRRPADEYEYELVRGSVSHHLDERFTGGEDGTEVCTLTADLDASLANTGSSLILWQKAGGWFYEFDFHGDLPIATRHESCSGRNYEDEVPIFGSSVFYGNIGHLWPAAPSLKSLQGNSVFNGTERDAEVSWSFSGVPHGLSAEELAPASITVPHRGGLRVRLFPPWATARSFEWQMKRSHQAQWTTIGVTTGRTLNFTFRLAGNFKLRTIAHLASAGGTPRRLVTGTRPLEVRFPTRDQILADQDVNSFTRDEWARTLRLATPQSRREVGFWITLDTCSVPRKHRRYDHTRRILGPAVGPEKAASVHLGPRPADEPPNPPAVIGCATYPVASFHTHTPTTYRLPLGKSRRVGPSRADEANARQRMTPGIVFDYITNPPGSMTIPFGYPMHNPAQHYRYGLLRRPTPRR
jgi:hypothetical protein